MKKIICLLTFVVFAQLLSIAQYNICKTQLYIKKSFAGNIAVDDNGNQITPRVTSTLLLYITTKGSYEPPFKQASIRSKKYRISFVSITDKKIEIGKKAEDETPLFIKTPKGYSLWQIAINPAPVMDLSGKTTLLEITLSGTQKGKKTKYIIRKKPIVLVSDPTP